MSEMIERWCSMKEITEHLGVSRDPVLSWIEKYNMPAQGLDAFGNFKLAMLMHGWNPEVLANSLCENRIKLLQKVIKTS